MKDVLVPRLEAAVRQYLAPRLKEDGFTGSGRTFRRLQGGWVQIVNVQSARAGGRFAINLGLHPLSIVHVLGEMPDPKKMTESLCEFRRRLSDGSGDRWWAHEPTQESMNAAAQAASEFYVSVGREIFKRVSGADSQFESVTPEAFAQGKFDFCGFGSTSVRMALVLARLRRAQDRTADSMEFAKVGLTTIGTGGALRSELNALARAAVTPNPSFQRTACGGR